VKTKQSKYIVFIWEETMWWCMWGLHTYQHTYYVHLCNIIVETSIIKAPIWRGSGSTQGKNINPSILQLKCQKLGIDNGDCNLNNITCNKSTMRMEGGSRKGRSWEVTCNKINNGNGRWVFKGEKLKGGSTHHYHLT
jgi:hypothetical protein